MSECLPDLPRYICQFNGEWQGADHQDGPWRPIPAPQLGLPWLTDGPAVLNREPASVVAEAAPFSLSPAAQAVLDAFRPTSHHQKALAAALRAAADQVVPANGSRRNNEIRTELLAIAAELEGEANIEPTTTEAP